MVQRISGYERIASDAYNTPPWVTRIIVPYIPYAYVWEPAAGSGAMVRVLRKAGLAVRRSTLHESGGDFLQMNEHVGAIVTNPPYSLAQKFVEHALDLAPFVAMLLPSEWDTAQGRDHLFDYGRFHKKIVITKRIRWIPGSTGSPSSNHAWFIWDASIFGRKHEIEYWYPE